MAKRTSKHITSQTTGKTTIQTTASQATVSYIFGIRQYNISGRMIYEVTATHEESGRRYSYFGPVEIDSWEDARELIEHIENYQAKTGHIIDPAKRSTYWAVTNCVGSEPKDYVRGLLETNAV